MWKIKKVFVCVCYDVSVLTTRFNIVLEDYNKIYHETPNSSHKNAVNVYTNLLVKIAFYLLQKRLHHINEPYIDLKIT